MMKNEEKDDDDAEKKNKQSNFIDHIFICTGIVYRLTTRSPKMMSKTIKKLRKNNTFIEYNIFSIKIMTTRKAMKQNRYLN